MRIFVVLAFVLFATSAVAEKVTVKPLSEVVIFPEFSAPASVTSLNNSRLGSEVAGRVVAVPVQVGDRVKKGDVLLRVDDFSYRQSLRQANGSVDAVEAKIELAEFNLNRARKLSTQKNVSEELLNQRQAELATYQAELAIQQALRDQAKYNLERTKLRAPFDGVVNARLVNVGEWTNPGTPVIHLVDTDQIEVSAFLQEEQVGSLSDNVEPVLDINGAQYPLSIRAVVSVVDPQKRHREIRLTFEGEPPMAGSSGRLIWQAKEPFLPVGYLLRRDNQIGAFVAEKGQARFVGIPTAEKGRPVSVEGWSSQTQIIVDGRFRVNDGDEVEVR